MFFSETELFRVKHGLIDGLIEYVEALDDFNSKWLSISSEYRSEFRYDFQFDTEY